MCQSDALKTLYLQKIFNLELNFTNYFRLQDKQMTKQENVGQLNSQCKKNKLPK